MSESPRWERESQEDLRASAPQPQDTVEMEAASPERLVDPGDLSDPPEYRHAEEDPPHDDDEDARAPRLAAVLESLTGARAGAREHLLTARGSAAQSLSQARTSLSGASDSMAETSRRVGRWVAALDRRPEFDGEAGRDPVAELTAGPAATDLASTGDPDVDHADPTARFPLALRGYDREAVDAHLEQLESELAGLRERAEAPMSISEEIERLGEQTASILVTAHDSAHETARRAQEQAARAVSTAAGDAERITTEAQRRLRELDAETDAVWRERERLLADVREVSATLATLADTAGERFPGELEPAATVGRR